MSSINEDIFNEAKARLRRIEAECGIRILYAGEVGSRARGVQSSDADYDVRFLFVRPVAEYLKLTSKPATIAVEDGPWDLKGIDLKETLVRLKDGDPMTLLWLYTNPVYRNHPIFETEMHKRLESYASLNKLVHHFFERLSPLLGRLESRTGVTYKTLMDAVEMVLSINWVEKRNTLPLLDFDEFLLTSNLPAELAGDIETLVREKNENVESAPVDTARYERVIEYVLAEAHAPAEPSTSRPNVDDDDINEFFLRWIGFDKKL